MAVVIAFRIAIALAPIGYRIINGPVPSTGNLALSAARDLWARITDPSFDPLLLGEELSRLNSQEIDVTDFTGTFEGRKVAIRWSRAGATGTTDDQAQTTIHFLKLASGAPTTWVDGTDDAAVETAFGTLWTSLKQLYKSNYHLDVYRWSKSGPAWDVTPAPYNPSYRVTEVDVAGTGTGDQLPPQCAISVTHKTSVRKRWGRCYLPAPIEGSNNADGRCGDAATIQGWWTTFLNACTTLHIQPVVMSRAHDAYTTPKGKAIAAQPFTAYAVTAVQVDDVFDVIRSRRWAAPTVRSIGVVTPG